MPTTASKKPRIDHGQVPTRPRSRGSVCVIHAGMPARLCLPGRGIPVAQMSRKTYIKIPPQISNQITTACTILTITTPTIGCDSVSNGHYRYLCSTVVPWLSLESVCHMWCESLCRLSSRLPANSYSPHRISAPEIISYNNSRLGFIHQSE